MRGNKGVRLVLGAALLAAAWLALVGETGDGFGTVRTAAGPLVTMAVLHGGSEHGRRAARDHGRMLSGAPVMLGLLAGVLARWGEAVEVDTEIDGGGAVEWLSSFVTDVRQALEQFVGPEAPEASARRQ